MSPKDEACETSRQGVSLRLGSWGRGACESSSRGYLGPYPECCIHCCVPESGRAGAYESRPLTNEEQMQRKPCSLHTVAFQPPFLTLDEIMAGPIAFFSVSEVMTSRWWEGYLKVLIPASVRGLLLPQPGPSCNGKGHVGSLFTLSHLSPSLRVHLLF